LQGWRKLFSGMNAWAFAVALALGAGPNSRGQVQQTSSQYRSDSESAQMKRLEDLEDQVRILRSEVVSLHRNRNSSSPAATMIPAVFAPPEAGAAETTESMEAGDQSEPAKTTLASLLGPTTLNGFVDVYYGFNFNHPANLQNALDLFSTNTNQFSLNLVELNTGKAPDPATGRSGRAGYYISVAYGQGSIGLIQAYSSYVFPIAKGLQIDAGKFVTTAGFEWAETAQNWNYSRSLLFSYAIPYSHVGGRATYRFSDRISLQGAIVNGWNEFFASSTAKTYAANLTWNPNKKIGIAETLYNGPQSEPGSPLNTSDWRRFSDTIVTYSATDKWAFALNGDYATGDRIHFPATASAPASVSPARSWWGAAGYAKYAWSGNENLAARYEYYSDPQGYTLFNGFGFSGGHDQEITATFTRMLTGALMTRLEYRGDFASRPIFEEGGAKSVRGQQRLTIAFVYAFDSHRIGQR
jgi:putative OmpL-like beta-barrel porin-2